VPTDDTDTVPGQLAFDVEAPRAVVDTPLPLVEPIDRATAHKQRLIGVVRRYADRSPRSQQTTLGASEIGTPCDRQLALKAVGAPTSTLPRDKWAAAVGTAVHAYLEKAFLADNARAEAEQDWDGGGWLTERAVDVGAGIGGTADLYEDRTVTDHKIVGDDTLAKVRACTCRPDDDACPHISTTYKVQAQLYGRGFVLAGWPVEQVAIAFWPRGNGAVLSKLHVWMDDYRPDVADRAIDRWQSILAAVLELDVEHHLDRAGLFATADAPCAWCPYFGPDRTGGSCTGHRPT